MESDENKFHAKKLLVTLEGEGEGGGGQFDPRHKRSVKITKVNGGICTALCVRHAP